MNVVDVLDRFQLHDDGILDEQVETVPADFGSVVFDGQLALLFNCKAALVEFNNERVLVDRFEKARSKLAMDLDRCADDLLRQRRVLQLYVLPLPPSS